MKTYTCDFETTTDTTDCRVWAWGAFDIESEEFAHGVNIDSWFRVGHQTN